jgi:hypothetical protein
MGDFINVFDGFFIRRKVLQVSEGKLSTCDCAVGILCRYMKSFAKVFEPSILAAFSVGPKQGIPTNNKTGE